MRFSRLNLRLAALAAALLALVAAGCGGGGEETTDATQAKKREAPARLTKAEFIVRGDGICGEVNSAVGAIEASEVEVASSERAAQVASLYTGMVERLTKLGTPADIAGYAEFSEAAEQLAKVENEVKAAAEEEDLVALEEASNAAVPALESFQSAAAVYGFEACSEGPRAPTATPDAGGAAPGEAGVEEEAVPGPEEEFVPEVEAEAVPEEEFVPEEEAAPETGGAGGIGEGGGEAEAPSEEPAGGGIGPG